MSDLNDWVCLWGAQVRLITIHVQLYVCSQTTELSQDCFQEATTLVSFTKCISRYIAVYGADLNDWVVCKRALLGSFIFESVRCGNLQLCVRSQRTAFDNEMERINSPASIWSTRVSRSALSSSLDLNLAANVWPMQRSVSWRDACFCGVCAGLKRALRVPMYNMQWWLYLNSICVYSSSCMKMMKRMMRMIQRIQALMMMKTLKRQLHELQLWTPQCSRGFTVLLIQACIIRCATAAWAWPL